MTTTTTAPRPGSIQSIWDLCYDVVANNYANFNGTATRREFWTWYFAKVITGYAALVIFPPAGLIIILGAIIPTLALGARRLHETGRSGWWQALQIIPLIGIGIVLIMLARSAKVITAAIIESSS